MLGYGWIRDIVNHKLSVKILPVLGTEKVDELSV